MRDYRKMPLGVSNALLHEASCEVAWLWDGILALEAVSLLSAPEKTGKSTLLSLLLDRRHSGGVLLGRTVDQGRSIVCTEESRRIWSLRQPPLDFGPNVIFSSPRTAVPAADDWKRFLGEVIEKCLEDEEDPYNLLVIDTASRFLPLASRNKNTLANALAHVKDLLGLPMAVLLINQSRNMHRPLAAFADIVIDMSIPRGVEQERRRLFRGVGRYDGTLHKAIADFNAEGTDYVLVTETAEPRAQSLLEVLQTLLPASGEPLTCRELLERWPGAAPRPDSLWRALGRGVETMVLVVSGKGTKAEPFRFGMNPKPESKGMEIANQSNGIIRASS